MHVFVKQIIVLCWEEGLPDRKEKISNLKNSFYRFLNKDIRAQPQKDMAWIRWARWEAELLEGIMTETRTCSSLHRKQDLFLASPAPFRPGKVTRWSTLQQKGTFCHGEGRWGLI